MVPASGSKASRFRGSGRESLSPDCEQERDAQAHEDSEANEVDETLHHKNAAGRVNDLCLFRTTLVKKL
jgi:hypothetical protein